MVVASVLSVVLVAVVVAGCFGEGLLAIPLFRGGLNANLQEDK